MIRLVLDTNVLVSVALPGSRLRALAEAWQTSRCRLVFSAEIFEKYLRVLTYPKFRLSAEAIRGLLERDFLPYAELVAVTTPIQVIAADPADDKFLACAVDGHAAWLVTGDHHLLVLNTFRGVAIVPPAEGLRRLRSSPQR